MAIKLKARPVQAKPETRVVRPRFDFKDPGVGRLVREIRSELRKVVWPSRREAINLTIVVMAVSAAVGAFLGMVDYIFQKLFAALVGAF